MERQFPKNVRQIGNVSDEPKIYVEDYVDIYLTQLQQQASEEPIGVMLIGEILNQEGQDVVYISGAMQMKEIEVTSTEIVIKEETLEEMEGERKKFFAFSQIVGWGLIESGHPMGQIREISKIHAKTFSGENTIFIWKDARDNEELYYAHKYGELMQMGGHYLYYEKNPSMQNYMIATRKKNGVTPSEMVEDRAAKDFRSAVRTKMEDKEQRQNSRLVYATSVLLVVVVLAIGVSTVNNFDKMEAVQSSLESLSQSVDQAGSQNKTVSEETVVETGGSAESADEVAAQGTVPETSTIQEELSEDDYYVVKKGDTLDSISVKLYGDSSHVTAICKMNGLSDGNLIYIGQKLLLP